MIITPKLEITCTLFIPVLPEKGIMESDHNYVP